MVVVRSFFRAGPTRLLFLGAPGVGKGTYATRMSKSWEIPHISTGDMIRAEIKTGSSLGSKFKNYSDTGALVPDALVVELACKRLAQPDAAKGFILDGFPRTAPQAEALKTAKVEIDACLSLSLRRDLLIQKLSGRRVCADCGGVYNVCDIDEGEFRFPALMPTETQRSACSGGCKNLEVRIDDSEETVKGRLALYEKETAPLIDFYKQLNCVVPFEVKKGVDDLPAIETAIRSFLKTPK